MNDFKEQFPELKDKWFNISWGYEEETKDSSGNYAYRKDVEKYCLSRQKVKEAIPEIIELFASLDDEQGVWGHDTQLFEKLSSAIKAVEKMLGLDDDN